MLQSCKTNYISIISSNCYNSFQTIVTVANCFPTIANCQPTVITVVNSTINHKLGLFSHLPTTETVYNKHIMPAQTNCSNASQIIMHSINILLNPITHMVQNVMQSHTSFLPFNFLTS